MVSFFRIFFFVKKREKEKTKGNMNGPLDLSKTAFSGFHSHQCIGFYQFLPFLLGPVKADITSCSVGLSVCRFVDCRSRLASSVLTGVLFITASTKVLDLPSKISAPAQPRVILVAKYPFYFISSSPFIFSYWVFTMATSVPNLHSLS